MKLTDLALQVRGLAAAYPNGKYRKLGAMCLYNAGAVENGPAKSVGCLIGQAAVLAGLGQHHYGLNSLGPVGEFLDEIAPDITDEGLKDQEYNEILDWLIDVQDRQDQGVLWGDAVKTADDKARRRTS